jgi:hypothetical protein
MELSANISPSEFRAYIVGPFVRGTGTLELRLACRDSGRCGWPRAKIIVALALVGILSGIFLFALSLLLFHILLQRRKAKAAKKSRPHHGAHHNSHHKQEASSASSFSFPSRRRGSRISRSDSESDVEGEEEEEKMNDGRHGSRASSLYLEPNQPLYVDVDVDVESESNDRGPHAGMQFILTPPTPGR